jgi:hypothetical protein
VLIIFARFLDLTFVHLPRTHLSKYCHMLVTTMPFADLRRATLQSSVTDAMQRVVTGLSKDNCNRKAVHMV